jgi:predicted  nucleic acid-binding Zn-ribbon protein
MEPEDLTIRLLQEIRDEVRRSSDRSEVRFEKMDQRFEKMDQRFEKMDQRFEKMDQRAEKMDQRAEIIETTLRDLAQQMVMLARGIKTALDHRGTADECLAVEERLDVLEKQSGH